MAGALAATLLLVITQPPGPGLEPDSTSYVGAAESFAHGHGYRIPYTPWQSADTSAPLSHFPPAFPTALALPIVVGVAPLQSARIVNAAAALADVVLATLIVADAAGAAAAALTALAILVMRPFVLTHLSILSEPLFLADLMASLALMIAVATAADERQRRTRAVAAGALGALSALTRYAGVAVGGAIVLWMLLLPGRRTTRLTRAGAAFLPPLILVGAWIIHVRLTSGSHGIRTFGTYGDFGTTLRMGAATVVAWLVPLSADQSLPGRRWLALLLLAALAIVVVLGARRAAPRARATIAAAIVLAMCYALVIVLSRVFADPGIPFDERILMPLFLLATIVIAVSLHGWWTTVRLLPRALSAIVLLAWLAASASASYDEAAAALDTGVDFAQDEWKLSPLVAWARDSAAHRPIYTNWAPVAFFHLGRASRELPHANEPDLLRAFVDTLRVRHGVAIVFEQRDPDFIGPADLIGVPGLRRAAQFPDGSAFVPAP